MVQNPLNSDTDSDKLTDGWEIQNNHDPLKWDNWGKLFGIYLLPAYLLVVLAIVIPITVVLVKRSKSKKITKKVEGKTKKKVTKTKKDTKTKTKKKG